MPAFTQSLRATEVSWDEWDVVSNGEWPVHVTDEWLVRH